MNNTSNTFEQVLDQEKNELTEALILFGEGKRVNKGLADLEMNRPKFYKFYEAGQQSRQVEIDKLQKRVKELELINFDSELHFDAAKEHIDLLQKRIDDALEKCYTGIRKQDGDYYLELIEGILKGIPNNHTGF